MMLGAVDTVMLSQYSDESVAAVGVVNQIVMFAFLIFEVINIGTSVLCSQYLGAGMRNKMVQVVGVSLLLNLVVGLVVSAILHYGATTLLGWMGLRPELLKYGIGYMEIVGAFAFFQAISLTISASLRSANKAILPHAGYGTGQRDEHHRKLFPDFRKVRPACHGSRRSGHIYLHSPWGEHDCLVCHSLQKTYSVFPDGSVPSFPLDRTEKPVEGGSPFCRGEYVVQFFAGGHHLFNQYLRK